MLRRTRRSACVPRCVRGATYLEQLSREVLLQVNLAKLHLTEDFRESARAFAEKRPAGPFKGR